MNCRNRPISSRRPTIRRLKSPQDATTGGATVAPSFPSTCDRRNTTTNEEATEEKKKTKGRKSDGLVVTTLRTTEQTRQLFRLMAIVMRTDVNTMIVDLVLDKAETLGIPALMEQIDNGPPASTSGSQDGTELSVVRDEVA